MPRVWKEKRNLQRTLKVVVSEVTGRPESVQGTEGGNGFREKHQMLRTITKHQILQVNEHLEVSLERAVPVMHWDEKPE